MTAIKEKLEELLKLRVKSGYRSEVVLHGFADEIIKLFGSNIKEKLYRKALEKVIKDDYEVDKYGSYCLECNTYTAAGKKLKHNSRKCRTKQLERIIAL